MANQFTIPQIINFAKISQYLAGNDKSFQLRLKSGSFIGNLEGLLYMEGYLLQNLYTLNPSSPTLISTGEYVLSLCGKYLQRAISIANAVAIGPPVVSGPFSVSVNVGGNASFIVTVTGSAPFSYQWFDYLGNPIPGATSSSYTFLNSQLSDSGKTFFVKVTDANGQSTTSSTATLTVTASLVGYFYQGNTDYSTDLLAAIDNVAYLGTFPITTGQPFTVAFPHIGATEYIVVKYPSTEPTKINYQNPPAGVDTGPIPDIAWNITTIGAFKYIFSRTGNPFSLNNGSGQIKFS
jgi:hypothetical protein